MSMLAVWSGLRYVSSVGFPQYVSKLLGVIERGACDDEGFNRLALELFALQFEHNAAYRRLVSWRPKPQSWKDIPAQPTAAFKETELTAIPAADRIVEFRSSGTTGQKPSLHFHSAESLRVYEAALGPPLRNHFLREGMLLLSLTPSPKEAPHSSLVHMFGTVGPVFAGRGDWSLDLDAAMAALSNARQPVGIMGTAFNFVHLLDALGARRLALPPGSRALETGGYKGRSREVSRADLHRAIKQTLGVSEIVIEYGMCELSSQAYAGQDGLFLFPPWVRTMILSPERGGEAPAESPGLLCVFDLANVWSMLAVVTEDLCMRRGDRFELLGRAFRAEPRGCSLMSR